MTISTTILQTCTLLSVPLALVQLAVAAPTHKSIPLDGGGYFSGFAVHSSGRLYGYGDVFGAWRSDNAGQSWAYLNGSITTDDNFVSGMAVAKGNADHVVFRSPGRLWKSTDGGVNWTASLSDLAHLEIVRGASPVMFHPGNDKELWMAGARNDIPGTLWRSLDSGTSWAKVGGTTFDSSVAITLYVRPEFPDQVWVGTKGALYVSVDRGGSWTQLWNNNGATSAFTKKPPAVGAIVRRKDGTAYVATDVGGYRVTATDWKKPETYALTKTVGWWDGWGPVNATVLADDSFITGGIHGDRDAKNPGNLQSAQRISTDGGLTWSYLPMNLSMPPQPVWSSAAKPGQKTGYGNDFIVQDPTKHDRWFVTGGLLPAISNNRGVDWKYGPNNSGIAAVMTYKVNFTRKNPKMALIPGGDLCAFVVSDGGASGNVAASSFRTVNKLTSCHEVMSSDDGKILVAAGTDQGANKNMIIRSTDSGATWTELDLIKSGLPESREGITRSAMTPGNPNDFLVILASNGGSTSPLVWRTVDGGNTFKPVEGLPPNLDTGSRYHPEHSMLAVDGVKTNVRYFSARKKLYRSNDNGATWSPIPHPWGTGAQVPWVHHLAVDRATAGKLWATADYAGLKFSEDGGDTWKEISGFNATYVDAANGQVAVFGMRDGDKWKKIYFSPDNGATWSEATGPGHRYAFTKGVAVDPWVPGKIWVSGISANVISGLPAGKPRTALR